MAKMALAAAAKAPLGTRPPVKGVRPSIVPVTPLSSVTAGEDKEQKDHFITRDGKTFAGYHLLIDLWEAEGLDDANRIEQALVDTVKEAGATLLHIHLHTFPEGGSGVSGVAVLAESHISVHTWPERQFGAFDVFMCGDAVPRKALDIFQAAFNPGRMVVKEEKRGLIE